ncbi:hypothetical protein FE257_010705 [Aspergillus nanangensis]|uniref:Alcohol dehydrogenase n=1 Tax=Aspergillus nanangensis TaxID=2582783 RepID=A0AAD4GR21_ASPNN|nr:hypothetical protein FE257_010705 [Aspergillus nanangensis]
MITTNGIYRRPVVIAGCSGGTVDRARALESLSQLPELDAIVGDWMSEADMTRNGAQRSALKAQLGSVEKLGSVAAGYHANFLDKVKPALRHLAGGSNAHGLAEAFVTIIPETLPLERLSPLFCAGITAFRAVQKLDLPAGGVVGVFGLGGVGRLVVQFCLVMGFRVLGFDISPDALKATRTLGAEGVADSSDQDAMAALVNEVCGSDQLSGAIVASGVGAAYDSAIELTVGVPHQPISVSIVKLVKKALRLQGTQTGNPREIHDMMKLVTKHRIIPEVELHAITEVPELMAALAGGKLQAKTGIVF